MIINTFGLPVSMRTTSQTSVNRPSRNKIYLRKNIIEDIWRSQLFPSFMFH